MHYYYGSPFFWYRVQTMQSFAIAHRSSRSAAAQVPMSSHTSLFNLNHKTKGPSNQASPYISQTLADMRPVSGHPISNVKQWHDLESMHHAFRIYRIKASVNLWSIRSNWNINQPHSIKYNTVQALDFDFFEELKIISEFMVSSKFHRRITRLDFQF